MGNRTVNSHFPKYSICMSYSSWLSKDGHGWVMSDGM